MAAVDSAEHALRALVLRGTLAPGDRLGEVELADLLGMSRTPVREALRRLASQGLVEITSNKGARVTAWSDGELEQVFALRAQIEGHAAAHAARQAAPEQVDELARLARAHLDAALPVRTRDLDRVAELNSDFHALLVAITRSSTLATALSGLVHTTVLARTHSAMDEAAMTRSAHHHLEIVAALRARDPLWAESVMRSHLLSARASLLGPRPAARPHDPTHEEDA